MKKEPVDLATALSRATASVDRVANGVKRKLERSVREGVPCTLSAREAHAVLLALKSWAAK